MAKLHSGKRGKSGTKRPKAKPSTVEPSIGKEEIKKLILTMAKEGTQESKIGLALRDKHGVPSVKAALGVPLSKVLKQENAAPAYPEDLISLIKKAYRVRLHLKVYKGDIHNKVKLNHIESKIQRLVKYYVAKKRLPNGWKYDPEKAALLVK